MALPQLMKWIQLFQVLLWLDQASAFEKCPRGYTYDSETCYKLVGSCKDWSSARAYCIRDNAFLFTVNTDRQFSLAQRIISGAGDLCDYSIWLGARRSSGQLRWEHDRTYMNHRYFAPGQPDNLAGENCVSIRRPFANQLNDHICTIHKKFICQTCHLIDNCKTVSCPSTPESTKCDKCNDDKYFYMRTNNDKTCEEMCSWDDNFCWPGTCSNKLTKSCICSTGFRKDTTNGRTLCQPTSKPELESCEMTAYVVGGDKVSAPNKGSASDCATKIDMYGNFQPQRISYGMTASFAVPTPLPSKPNYIEGENFGVTDAQIVLRHVPVHGQVQQKTFEILQDTVQTEKVTSPVILSGYINNSYTLVDGDRLCLRYIARGGGYLKYTNVKYGSTSSPIAYSKKSNDKDVCYRFDSSSPQHCAEIGNCTWEPLHVSTRITRYQNVDILFKGWFDPIPKGSNSSYTAKIKSFEITVREVQSSGPAAESSVDYLTKASQTIILNNTNVDSLALNLSSTVPKLFCITIEVRDVANNIRQARRFVLVDNVSEITTTSAPMRFSSASLETTYKWQTHHGELCLNWNGHFTNLDYMNNPLLKPIKPAPNNMISRVYEQLSGDIPVKGTPNVNGIINFSFSWSLNNGTFTTDTEVPEFPKEQMCLNMSLVDGQTYTFNVTAKDIVNNTYEETRTIHIDATAPHINRLGLVKNGYEGLFAYGETDGDMSKIHLSFEVLDPHSGIEDIQWSFGTRDSSDNLMKKHMQIQRIQGNCSSIEFCYKPSIGSSENYKYHLLLNGSSLVDKGLNIGDHNRNYFFTVKVTNQASLTNIEHLDIILDKSPPEKGVVNEGPVSNQDIDYTNDDFFQVHWHGFIDHESGVKLFRVAVATKCLTREEINHQSNRSEFILYEELPWTDSSLRVTTNITGKMFVSVVALNNALESSQAACSDGITRDISPPNVKNILIHSAQWTESIVCHRGLPWLMHFSISKVLLNKSRVCVDLCVNQTDKYELPDMLPTISTGNKDTDVLDFMCSSLPTYNDDYTLYVPNDHIVLSWDVLEDESQMQDYFVGFGNYPTEKSSPGILVYQSTDQKRYFRKAHQGIGSNTIFYIFIKSVNKAGSETIATIGPVLIDETPPLIKENPVVEIQKDVILIGWQNDSFYDQEQIEPISQVFFQIKTRRTSRPVTPLLEWRAESSKRCVNLNFSGGCVIYPLNRLQQQDTIEGLEFFVSLYPYNNAGHSARSDLDAFKLPSKYSPGHGSVLDINPNAISAKDKQTDIHSHSTNNTLCFSWTGFNHHEKVEFNVGIGTEKGRTNVIGYTTIPDSSCLTSEKLQYFVKYFVGIRATCSGGQTETFSDGVTIVSEMALLDSLKVFPDIRQCDQLIFSQSFQCNESQNDSISIGHNLIVGRAYLLTVTGNHYFHIYSDMAIITHYKQSKWYIVPATKSVEVYLSIQGNATDSCMVTLGDCTHMSYLKSTKKLYVNINTDQMWNINITYLTAISMTCTNTSSTVCQRKVSAYERTEPDGPISISDIPLKENIKYNLLVKPCVDSGCLNDVISQEFYFETQDPTGSLKIAEMIPSVLDDCMHVSLSWKEFTSNSGISFYQWAISDDKMAMHTLTRWKFVTNDTDHVYRITECVSLPIFPHDEMYACVRATTKAGNTGVFCRHFNLIVDATYSANILYEFDSSSDSWISIQKMLHSSGPGKLISLLHKAELDIGNSRTKVTGALLYASDRNVTWYLMTQRHTPKNCDLDISCIRSDTTCTGFIDISQDSILAGQHYFVCGYSEATHTERESSTEVLVEIDICSDGFIIDNTKPSAGKVQVNSNNGYVTDIEHLSINWTGFYEDIDLTKLGYLESIKEYKIGIGRRPKDVSIMRLTNVGQVSSAAIDNINISNGDKFYVSVMATNYASLSTIVSSKELTVDITPPLTGYITIVEESATFHGSAVVSNADLTVLLSGCIDKESGIDFYYIGVGSRPDNFDVIPKESHVKTVVDLHVQENVLNDGVDYYILVQVVNRAGLVSSIFWKKFVIDKTPPTGGHVMDGRRDSEDDEDFQSDTTFVSGYWNGFEDKESGIAWYEVGFGTSAYTTDIEGMTNVGLRTDISWHSSIITGQKYFITVRGCNGAGLCRTLSSDGVIFDNSPQIGGVVQVGSSDIHQHYLPQKSSVFIKWFGFDDPQSEINRFESCIGSRPAHCDLYPFHVHLLASSVTRTSLDLKENVDMYATIRSVNNVGMTVIRSSKPFRVDTSPPYVVSKPYFVATHVTKPGFSVHFERSLLQIKWEFSDHQSPVVRHTLTLLTHHEGHTPVENLEIGSENNITLNMDGNNWLHNGDRYYAKVTSCNAADLCTTARSDDILIDSTPPHMGGFGQQLVWENKLDKYGVLKGSLRLKWYGFVDRESGVRAFYVNVGRTYGGGQLSNGTIEFRPTPNTTKQSHTMHLNDKLSLKDIAFLTLWAENFAGLNSSAVTVKVTAILQSNNQGILEIEKHSCLPEYCTGDCTCAVIGKICHVEKAGTCRAVNISNEIGYPRVHVITGQRASPETVTPSSCCLAIHWNVENATENKNILRFEWSIGITGSRYGEGFFDTSEIPWKDAGTMTEIIHCLPRGTNLMHGESYTAYVRAWYDRDEYIIYQSEPIKVDQTPPGVSKRNHIIDSDESCNRDFDFIDWMDTISACWHSVFFDTESSIAYYTVALGTLPLADDIFATTRTGSNTSITLNSVVLEHGVKYFFTVTAYNTIGLSTRNISDGFLVDMDNPVTGIVYNTGRYFDKRFQSRTDSFNISWHGFVDHYAGIKHYMVAMNGTGTNNTTDENFINVGLNTRHSFKVLHLKHNGSYTGIVKAIDAAGHESNIEVSAELIIDTTEPEGHACSTYEVINTIFEKIDHEEFTVLFANVFELNRIYKISGFMLATNSDIHAEIIFGRIRQKLHVITNHNGTLRFELNVVSPLSGQYNVTLHLNQGKGAELNMTLSACTSSTEDKHSSVLIRQVSEHTLLVDMLILDPESHLYQIKVGAGTTPQGFQIQQLTSAVVGNSHLIDARVSHGSRVWVTVIAENHAGLRSSFTPRPVTIDHTGPEIDTLDMTQVLEEPYIDDNQTERQLAIKANWSVEDLESGVKACYCAFGIGQPVPIQFEEADNLTSCVSSILALNHGEKVFVTILCINNIELATQISSNTTVAFDKPSNENAYMWFIGQDSTDITHSVVKSAIVFPDKTTVSIQSNCTCLNFEWMGYQDPIGIAFYEYRIVWNDSMIVDWTKTCSRKTYDSTCPIGRLQSGNVYTVQVRAVNEILRRSDTIEGDVLVECNRPYLQEAPVLDIQLAQGILDINWANSFAAHPLLNMTYSLMIGSRRGYSDVRDDVNTATTSTSIVTRGLDEVYIILTGYYPTGMSSTFETNIRL